MKILFIIMFCFIFSGCVTTISKKDFAKIIHQRSQEPVFHLFYMGSKNGFQYFNLKMSSYLHNKNYYPNTYSANPSARIIKSKIYRISNNELHIKNEYSFSNKQKEGLRIDYLGLMNRIEMEGMIERTENAKGNGEQSHNITLKKPLELTL